MTAEGTGDDRRRRTVALLVLLVLVFALGFGAGYLRRSVSETPTTTSLISPDGTLRARLREGRTWIDRNFDVVLEDPRLSPAPPCTIFTSPDEGVPAGTERFLWSADSATLFLVGRHFFTDADAPALATGETLYLMVHVPTGTLRCNARQASLPRFTADDAIRAGIGEDVRRTPPPRNATRPATQP